LDHEAGWTTPGTKGLEAGWTAPGAKGFWGV